MTAEPRLLIVETSGRVGEVAVATGAELRQQRCLDDARRHARDLAPAVAELLASQGWRPRDLHAVIVSRGPGSYTGLRVGIMSAKTLAYATGCALIAIDTFAAIAQQAPPETDSLDVLSDAQQDRLYVQHFRKTAAAAFWEATSALAIVSVGDWLVQRDPTDTVTGPGFEIVENRLPGGTRIVAPSERQAHPASLLRLGLARFQADLFDDHWSLEPLYARPSAAEEKWAHRGKGSVEKAPQ